MMTLEETIDNVLKEYYDLFPTKAHVLEHMYCVIGNGYEWKKGRLVRKKDRTDFSMNMLKKFCEDFNIPFNRPRKISFEERKLKIYPISFDYSKIFTVPDNVKDDYLLGAYKMISIILKHPASGNENKTRALLALSILNSRFKNRKCIKQYV